MSHRLSFLCVALAAIVAAPAMVTGQVQSHQLDSNWPENLVPGWVSKAPPYYGKELEPTRPASAPSPKYVGTSSAALPADAREVIRLAEGAEWAAAANAGQAFLRRPGIEANDYTWDYVANATAWALIQTGKLTEAAAAHGAAAVRLRDTDTRTAHRLVCAAIQNTRKPADQLKKPAVYQAEVRAHVADRVKRAKDFAEAARKSTSSKTLLYRFKQAYGETRILAAVDPALGQALRQDELRPTADILIGTLVPNEVKRARAIIKELEADFHNPLPHRITGKWNSMLNGLWNQVAETKRLCRVHHYLASLGLASSGQARGPFREAHKILFAQGNQLVWQPIGYARIVNNISQKDLRRRVPWQQTKVSPLDVALAQHSNQSGVGWKQFDNMDGDNFQKMNGNNFQKMDGGWNKMEGNGWKEMGGNGWNQFNGNGWKKP